jgi:nitrous oxidase accessory protein NosD
MKNNFTFNHYYVQVLRFVFFLGIDFVFFVQAVCIDPCLVPLCRENACPCSNGLSDIAITKILRKKDFTVDRRTSSPAVRTYNVTVPGTYVFAESILYHGSPGNDTALRVMVSDVVIDLNNYTLSGNKDGALLGITIASGASNVMIKNGKIVQFRTSGISNDGNNDTIVFKSISLLRNKAGVVLNRVNDLQISQTYSFKNENIGISLENIESAAIEKSRFSHNGCGVYIINSKNIAIDDSFIEDNHDSQLYCKRAALLLERVYNVALRNIRIQDNSAVGGFYALYAKEVHDIVIRNSNIIKNYAETGTCWAIYFKDSSNFALYDSSISRNYVTDESNSYGLYLDGTKTSLMSGCTIAYHTIGVKDLGVVKIDDGAISTTSMISNTFLYNEAAFELAYAHSGSIDATEPLSPGGLSALRTKFESVNTVIKS